MDWFMSIPRLFNLLYAVSTRKVLRCERAGDVMSKRKDFNGFTRQQ